MQMTPSTENRRMGTRIIVAEVVGVCAIVLLLWLDELIDLPHLMFGSVSTPVNWRESLMETIGVLILGAALLTVTWRSIRRIRYLEGFLSMCAKCKRIKVNDTWLPLEDFLSTHSNAILSHGLCPHCLQRFLDDDPASR